LLLTVEVNVVYFPFLVRCLLFLFLCFASLVD
jgi:hypothetical protein